MSNLNFKEISFEDIHKIKKYLVQDDSKCTDYTFGFLTMWGKVLNLMFSVYNETLFVKGTFRGGRELFYMPCGKMSLKDSVSAVVEYCKEKGISPEFVSIPFEKLESFKEHFNVEYTESRDYSDYVYSAEKLAFLKGRKYHQKRNHISGFKKRYPDYEFEIINDENIDLVKKFFEEFINLNEAESESEEIERKCSEYALNNIKNMDLIGALIKVGGKVIAFTLGEVKNDVLYVHVEKADRDFKGSYPTINSDFVKHCLEKYGISWVNREDDSGDMGLRKAKLSYYPEMFAVKGKVKILL